MKEKTYSHNPDTRTLSVSTRDSSFYMSEVNKIGIFGTSGMAREAGDIAFALGLTPIYIARDFSELAAWPFSAKIILEQNIKDYSDIPYVIGIGDSSIRESIAERFKNKLNFTNLIHPSATFGDSQRSAVERRVGNIFAAGARLTSGIEVGDFCIFNQNITVAHDCQIGSYVHIAPGANISGNVRLGNGCWIGAGAVINQGSSSEKLEIGAYTTIGSGAVVLNNCAPEAVYAGVPAKRLK